MTNSYQDKGKRSAVSVVLERIYRKDLIAEMKDHWNTLLRAGVPEKDFYYHLNGNPPWFGDFVNWREEMKKMLPEDLWDKYPSNLREYESELACEMDYLFPQKALSKTFLPILITSYCMKRPKTSETLAEKLYYGMGERLRFSSNFRLLFTSNWETSFSRFHEELCDLNNPQRIFRLYVKIIIFLTFLLKTKDVCNVSWSFYVFECMTDYLYFLGSDAKNIIEQMEKKYSDGVASCAGILWKDVPDDVAVHFIKEQLREDPYKEQVCRLASMILNDQWLDEHDGIQLPFNFGVFNENLKQDLLLRRNTAIDLDKDENDLCSCIDVIDARREAYIQYGPQTFSLADEFESLDLENS